MEAIQRQCEREVGKFTDDDIDVIDGKRQQLVGKIQQRYGLAKDAAERQADEFVTGLNAEGRAAAREEGRQSMHQHFLLPAQLRCPRRST